MRQYTQTEVMDSLHELYKAYTMLVKNDAVKEEYSAMTEFENTFDKIWTKYVKGE